MLRDDLNLLIAYAKQNLKLDSLNEIYVRNTLMKKFNLDEEYYDTYTSLVKDLVRPDKLIEILTQDLLDAKLANEDDVHLLVDEIFGDLTLSPNEFLREFNKVKEEKGGQEALSYFYDYQIKNNYIQKTSIEKNIVWREEDYLYPVEISINLSKPEKKNSDIAKLKLVKSTSYPKCLLCKENLGFYGDFKRAPRRTIRFIPVTLDNQRWYLQYSPYGYYYQHAICFSEKHSDMIINKSTFKKLLDFVSTYPTFFMGSNADLPVVGGSILNHEHFQGGNYVLPIFKSKDKKEFKINNHPSVKVTSLSWYNSVVKLVGESVEEVASCAEDILNTYKNYDDEAIELLSKTDAVHSTITPIARNEEGKLALYLIFRNNRTSNEHPDGIFHAHKEYHNIKSEGIGLIEAMGLFILPARLIKELKEVRDVLIGEKTIAQVSKNETIVKHIPMINKLVEVNGISNTKEKAADVIREYINDVCRNILVNTAVFKDDEKGNESLEKLLKKVGN